MLLRLLALVVPLGLAEMAARFKDHLPWGINNLYRLGFDAIGLIIGFAALAFIAAVQLQVEKDKDEDIAHELETMPITLNGVEVSIARVFCGLRDFFAHGLAEWDIPSLLASRFLEENPTIWSTAQRELITKLRIKKLIRDEQRQTSLHGTVTHFVLTDLGCEVLDRLEKR